MLRLIIVLCAVSLVAGCTGRRMIVDDDDPSGADPSPDSGFPALFDAGSPDSIDAGSPSSPDASPGVPDSGGSPDSGNTCSESPCRLVSEQCGCPGGDACDLEGSTRMCRSAGVADEGGACSDATPCLPGLTCVGPDDGVNFCARFCESDGHCIGEGSLCIGSLSDEGVVIPNVNLCTVDCDPAIGTGCPASWGCTIFQEVSGALRFFTSCRPADVGGAGDFCDTEEDCQSGFRCYENQCRSWCILGSGVGCDVGTCTTISTAITVGSTSYGTCL